jgi:RNA polymerase sigma-70 factor, ECF subfamily
MSARADGFWSMQLESVQAFEFVGGRISHVRIQRNPDKLAHLKRQGHQLLRADRL